MKEAVLPGAETEMFLCKKHYLVHMTAKQASAAANTDQQHHAAVRTRSCGSAARSLTRRQQRLQQARERGQGGRLHALMALRQLLWALLVRVA